ncbi:MAG: MraY family glycosyltransferase [Armatimonadota bacterium]|nr:MraY family glycosyltransferase [Armatimonadota bacterium]
MMSAVLAIAVSLVASYFLTPLAGKVAWKIGAVHQPGERRVHTTATPGFGGLAIYIGFTAAVLLIVAVDKSLRFDGQVIAILAAGTLVAIFGAFDDKYDLPAVIQALGIVIATLVLIHFGIKISHITKPFDAPRLVALGALSIPITIIWVFGVTKTVDLIDGLDGLASGICAIAATTLLLMAIQAKSAENIKLAGSFHSVSIMAAALIGASLGFLRHNYPPAKIFMGTIGSQFMGFILASISIVGAFKVATLVAVAVPVFALGVPIIDAAFVVVRRFLERRPVHVADKSHVHHRLLERGLSHGQVVLIIYGLTIALSATALTLYACSR